MFGVSRLRRNGVYNFTFTTDGVFPFYCTPHPAMVGVVTVAIAVPDVDGTWSPTGPPTPAPTTAFGCDADAIAAVVANESDPNAFTRTAGLAHPCKPVLIASCSKIAPALQFNATGQNEMGNCMVRDPDCLEEHNFTCADAGDRGAECGMSAAGFRRFCACRPNDGYTPPAGTSAAPDTVDRRADRRDRRDAGDVGDIGDVGSSPASRAAAGPFAVLAMLGAGLHLGADVGAGGPPRRLAVVTVAVSAVLSLATPATAHNWQWTPGRAREEASTTAPCRGRKDSDTHAQVGPGQDFAVQWATGHNRPSYWVVIHEDNYEWMRHKDFKEFVRDYIALAPASANSATEPRYQRLHGVRSGGRMTSFEEHILTDDLAGGGSNGLSTYGPRVEPDDPLWLNHTWSIPQNLFKFKPAVVANDARVSYRSEKYPWLEAAYRYEHETHRPGDFDTVRVSLPGRSGPGHYIVHWWWNGYYDCMDVDLFAEPVPDHLVYGVDLGTYAWEKIDHCQYVEPREVITDCMDATVSASGCREVIDRLDDPSKYRFRLGLCIRPVFPCAYCIAIPSPMPRRTRHVPRLWGVLRATAMKVLRASHVFAC